MELSQHLFWDTDPSTLDYEKNARWLIERVYSRGRMSDVRKIQAYYGDERILKEMLETRYLDPQMLNFFSVVYDTPKEEFRCYKLQQLNPGHWPS
jgi:hypothetical protein